MQIVMDNITYRLRVKMGSLEESFRIEDGPNADTLLTGEESRDIIGTYYEHKLSIEPDPRYYQDYLDFYRAISAPVDSHTITLPHENGTITYAAMVTSGRHSIKDRIGTTSRFTGLTVTFKSKAPQRAPE